MGSRRSSRSAERSREGKRKKSRSRSADSGRGRAKERGARSGSADSGGGRRRRRARRARKGSTGSDDGRRRRKHRTRSGSGDSSNSSRSHGGKKETRRGGQERNRSQSSGSDVDCKRTWDHDRADSGDHGTESRGWRIEKRQGEQRNLWSTSAGSNPRNRTKKQTRARSTESTESPNRTQGKGHVKHRQSLSRSGSSGSDPDIKKNPARYKSAESSSDSSPGNRRKSCPRYSSDERQTRVQKKPREWKKRSRSRSSGSDPSRKQHYQPGSRPIESTSNSRSRMWAKKQEKPQRQKRSSRSRSTSSDCSSRRRNQTQSSSAESSNEGQGQTRKNRHGKNQSKKSQTRPSVSDLDRKPTWSDSRNRRSRDKEKRKREQSHTLSCSSSTGSDSNRRQKCRGRSASGDSGLESQGRERHRTHRESCSRSDSKSERSRRKRSKSKEKHQKSQNHGSPSKTSSPPSDSGGACRENHRNMGTNNKEKIRNRRSASQSSFSSVTSSSPSHSQSPGEDLSQDLTLQENLSLKTEKKQQREMLKAMETPEEKRARRLAKKEAKERKKREKMGWGEEYMGYTNTDNPFGDNNLLGSFIWHKALEKKGIGHLGEKDLKDRNKRIQEDNRLELQKVKQLRLEREREKAMREQELEMLQREKEAEHFKTWEEQEDNFHLQQAKLRSKIRIRDGRAKPIDLLAKYISAEDDDLAVEMHEPYTFLNGLTVSDLEDLLEDIQIYMELEQGKNVDFWRDMTTITEEEISKLRKLQTSGKGPGERREGVNTSVSSDVQSVFKGKTYIQLQVIYQGIENKVRAGGPNLDIGYWESLLQQLKAYMARARLRERHQDVLRQKLYKLKQEQGVESEPLFPIIKKEPQSPSNRSEPEESAAAQPGPSTAGASEETEGDPDAKGEGGEAVLMEEDLIQQSLDDYDVGKYSPKLLTTQELPFDAHVVDFEEDLQRLLLCRQQLQVTGDAIESAEDIFVRKAKEGMGGDEARFSVEVPLTSKAYLWADKYRPRKPRFFNRVHTGFEWNKYNQTHYDFDNPPPKIVQGYKFNIFYPDLIDKRSTPEYFLEVCQDNKDFAILRFHAGPPYEDIAFKIVSREWEYSHRHGFRCQFSNGIFQLWFHFKRYRYRR
ncbi:cactin [Rhinatrema bivittatum]|uniref:cactin n=1 Tax=Rhinatrema bivittatum TaxID=194408 RepID=UPI00112DE7C2|nr:cactin [Rhinatrema bivittatum]